VKWSFTIGRLAGTTIRLHVTFLLLLVGIATLFFVRDGPAIAVGVSLFTLALFGCVLLHEFGHVFAARAFGVRTPDITLLPIGGIARLEKLPEKPWQELIVAIAGPLVNVVIAAVLLVFVGMPNPLDPQFRDFTSPIGQLQRLMVLNIWLVIFNMIPAFPMDGGRVLRALLAMVLPYGKATSVAAVVGQVLAGLAAVVALMMMHPLLFFVAVFIFLAARGESEAVQTREALRDFALSDAMMTTFQTLPRDATLEQAAHELLAGSQHDFPVLDENGSLAGILTRTALIQGLTNHGPAYPVEAMMVREVPPVYPATPLRNAFELLRSSPFEMLPVLDSRGSSIVGLLSAENVGELLLLKGALANWNGR
jgi:Zn-dependent protease